MSHLKKVWPKLILIGSSSTQYSFSADGCWGSLLANFLQRKCDVINRIFWIQHKMSHGVPREKVVIIGPPASRECTKSNTETAKYAKACVEAAKESGCCSVDMYTEMVKEKDWENMLNDGLHLSSRGCEYLFDLLKPVVTKITAELPMLYPDWKQVDTNNPELPFNGK
ncbi:IAH1 [Mytilus edulis]|uniref:IAH1 n=1 Tax=Mytilus edulis TaxID=6550 RepID=A0A8S3TGC9_MYTED|nr:IAH1 [Mytilus edulis]